MSELWRGRPVFVTGGSGLLGTWLITRLRAMAADLQDERETKARKRAPELVEAAARIEAAVDLLYHEAIPRQRGLKASLETAVAELRAHLEEMNQRIASVVSEGFVESLYPALANGRTCVADEGDEDDDAAARLVED